MVTRSSIPIGFAERIKRELGGDNLMVSPEFMRERKALHDSVHPSRSLEDVADKVYTRNSFMEDH